MGVWCLIEDLEVEVEVPEATLGRPADLPIAEHTAKGPSDAQGFVPFAQIIPIPEKVSKSKSKSDPLI